MYHELQRDGHSLCRPEGGYTRYVASEKAFRGHLQALKSTGFTGVSVGKGLTDGPERRVVITFDDGCETDLIVAAPLLKEHMFSATFYVVSGWVGKPGFLTTVQLRELASMGFEIGSHSRSHAFLSDLSPQQIQAEIDGSKRELEQILGQPVRHFSCPGGRSNQFVKDEVKAAGYESLALSAVGLNLRAADKFALSRVAVTANTTAETIIDWSEGKRLLRMQARSTLLDFGKRILGNNLYEKVRDSVMGSEWL